MDKVAVYEQLPSCTGAVTSLSLYSWTQPQLEARFGPRAKKESFRVEERQGEFYNGIAEIYPTTNPENRNVPLEEWTWTTGDCRLTVWFHRPDETWRALDDVLWHKDDEF